MRDVAHRQPRRGVASSEVHLEQLAGEGLDDLLVVVENHVEGEVDPGLGGDRADVVVHGVALADAPGRLGAPDPPRVMQRQGGLEPGQPRRLASGRR